MTINVGVIGLGHWGPNLVRSFMRNSDATVSAVCDSRPQAFERVSSLVGAACRTSTKAEDLIDDPTLDALVIVTPASTQADLARRALEAGKHVFCEKPLGFERKTLSEIGSLADAKGLKLMVGYTFLFNASIQKIDGLIKEGRLGDLYYLTAARTHMGLVRHDVSVIWDLASHDVAIMNHLLKAKPLTASASTAHPLGNAERCDAAFLNLTYPGGVIANIKVSWVDSHKVRGLDIVGSKARATFDDLDNLEPVRLFEKGIGVPDEVEPDFGAFRYLVNDGDIISPKVTLVEPLKAEVEAFVDLVKSDTANPATAAFAADVSAVLDAAVRSEAQGGAPVSVE